MSRLLFRVFFSSIVRHKKDMVNRFLVVLTVYLQTDSFFLFKLLEESLCQDLTKFLLTAKMKKSIRMFVSFGRNHEKKKGSIMKKRLLAALMAGAMMFSLTACGGGGGDTGGSDDASKSQPSTSDGDSNADNANNANNANNADNANDANASGGEGSTAGSYNIGICQLVQHEALDAATKGFRDRLEELITANGGSVSYDEQNASGESANCTTIINGFVSSGVDLILANATAALQAAQNGTTDIPVLGTSVTDYATALDMSDWNGKTGTNISGTTDLAPLDGQADMLHELFPDATNVGLMYCSAEPNSKYQIDTIKPMLEDLGYTCTEYSFADSNDVASVATQASSASDVMYIPTDNTAASCTEAIRNVVVPAKVPVIAGEQGICKGCGVATLSIDYYELGETTGDMAYDILVNGNNPGDMEVKPAPNFTKMYNASVCEELGITIPDGYEAIPEE